MNTGQFKNEIYSTRFYSFYIIRIKQFHKEAINYKVKE